VVAPWLTVVRVDRVRAAREEEVGHQLVEGQRDGAGPVVKLDVCEERQAVPGVLRAR
jgi:hypothetical protein